MKYRSDIDGLRALAVLAVVQFHLSTSWLASGGFVGVDIFFVISGYLITGIIFEGFEKGTYSIAEFYDRRIRRIFPALVAVYLAIMLASVLLRFPGENAYIGQTIMSSVLFVSNIFFSRSFNYFDTTTVSNPALHTWSLSVEEQFYIVFPILLFVIGRLPIAFRRGAIPAALVVSFLLAIWWLPISPTETFYLLPYRAWELLLGSVLAIGLVPKTTNRFTAEAIGLVGLAAMLYAVFAYSEATPFPGLSAALPCLGAAAVIYAGSCHQGLASRLLSLSPITFIGKISYSMYLWHWPIFVFYAYLFPFRGKEKLALLAAVFVISWLSWRFIEQPFRTRSHVKSRGQVFALGATSMAAVVGLAFFLQPISAILNPTNPRAEKLVAALQYDNTRSKRVGICFLDNTKSYGAFKHDICLKPVAGKRNVLIIGDSHAAHLYSGYKNAFPDIHFLQATASGCKPLIDGKGTERCVALRDYVLKEWAPANHIDTIIISSQWQKKEIAGALEIARALKASADHVVISGPIVEYRQNLPRIVATAVANGEDPDQRAIAYRYLEQAETDDAFKQLQWPEGISYISPYSALCAPTCKTLVTPNIPMQFDYGHLTDEGSLYLARILGAEAGLK